MTKTRSRFKLSAEIHLQYFLHIIVLVPLCMILGAIIAYEAGAKIGAFFSGLNGFFLFMNGASDVMSTYTHNKLGSERVSREMYRHRDVFSWNTDAAAHWHFAKQVGHYRSVIPCYIWGITLTFSISLAFREDFEHGWLAIVVLLISFIIVCILNAYVDQHLCSPEIGEMYRDPGSYSKVLDQKKEEAQQEQQDIYIQAQLEREQSRNQGLPPEESQYKRPENPY